MAKACYAKDKTDSDNCHKGVWHELKPVLIKGEPELNIKPFDPIPIDNFRVEDKGSVVTINATFTKITAVGGKDFTITSIVYDKVNQTVVVKLQIPILKVTGLYEVDGTILLLPLVGKGPFVLNLTGIDATLTSHLVRKGNAKTISKLDAKFVIKDIKLDLEGLLSDDTVSQSVKNMLNENSQQILADFLTKAEEVVSNTLRSSVEAILSGLPD